MFTDNEIRQMFFIARESILAKLRGVKPPAFTIESENLKIRRGLFVTLTNAGQLRGCIGYFDGIKPLWELAAELAVSAACEDSRFAANPITVDEMDSIEIKLSVLSERRRVYALKEIEIGRHGIWITQNGLGGTYLPEVAVDMNWDAKTFVEHCSVHKAGLPADAWKKGAELYVYTSMVLSEPEK